MLDVLLLVGGGLVFWALIDGGNDSSEAEDEEPERPDFPGPDELITVTSGDAQTPLHYVDNDQRDLAQERLDAQVSAGEITQEEADAQMGATQFGEGAVRALGSDVDDSLLLGEHNDRVFSYDGDDSVQGGAGDDAIFMGDGNDVYGASDAMGQLPDGARAFAEASDPDLDPLQEGDDTIRGGAGEDDIADGYGANVIYGDLGRDFIVTVDQDREENGVTADTVFGGFGGDSFVVDEGDQVTTGADLDHVNIDLTAGYETGYGLVEITDFDPKKDGLELTLDVGEEEPVLIIAPYTDETGVQGAVLSLDGVDIARVVGGQNLSAADIRVTY
jgi:Ca2+-binding RTX toxin-like protein